MVWSEPMMAGMFGSKNCSFTPLVYGKKEYWPPEKQLVQSNVPGWLLVVPALGTSDQMPRQKQGGGGTRSESHEPQMWMWVIGPVALQRKSSASILGRV